MWLAECSRRAGIGVVMLDTVPKMLTPELRQFCAQLSPNRPRFVKSRPVPDAKFGECFNNVARAVLARGGSTVYGWAIWHLKGAYFEAEHHGIWQKKSGDWLDVTPQVNGFRKIVFLPDPDAIYDPINFRLNVMQSVAGSAIGQKIVAASLRRNSILARYRAGGVRVATLSEEDNAEVNRLLAEINHHLLEYTSSFSA